MSAVFFHTWVEAENKLWFVSGNMFLMNMDIDTHRYNYAEIENSKSMQDHIVTDTMVVKGQEIFWVARDGRCLGKYSIDKKVCQFYDMPQVEYKNWVSFAGVVLFGDKIYIFPKYTQKLIVFDTLSNKFKVVESFYSKLKGEPLEGLSVCGETAYIYMASNACIISFNLRDGSYTFERISDQPLNIIFSVVFEKHIFYLCDDGIYEWDPLQNRIIRDYRFANENNCYQRFVVLKTKFFILPSGDNNILSIDRQTGKSVVVDNMPADLKFAIPEWSRYIGYCENEKYIWYAIRSANYYLRFDKTLEIAEWFKPILPSADEERKHYIDAGRKYFNQWEDDLSLLFAVCMHGKGTDDNSEKQNIGGQIWRQLR